MRRPGPFAATVLVLLAATAASADPMEQVQDNIETFARSCGGKVTVSVDWPSFQKAYTDQNNADNAAAYCGDIVDSLAWVCSNDDSAKPAVQQIHAVRCVFDRSVGDRFAFDLRDGTLVARFTWDSSNASDRVHDWVENLPAAGAASAPGASGAGAGGLSVRQARERARAQPEIDQAAGKLRAACGPPIAVTVDWRSFEPAFNGSVDESSAAGWCSGVLEQVAHMCKREPEARRTIARTIKSATCRLDAAAGDKYRFTLTGGTLVIGFNFNSGDDGDSLARWLWNTLD